MPKEKNPFRPDVPSHPTEEQLQEMAVFGAPVENLIDPDGQGKAYLTLIRDIKAVKTRFLGAVELVKRDANLTDMGKKHEIQRIAQGALREFNEMRIEGTDRGIDNAIRAGKAVIQAKQRIINELAPPRDSAAQAVRHTYLWDLLRKVDPLEIQVKFIEAIQSGDEDTYYAIAQAPKMLRLVPEKMLHEGRAQWNAQLDPMAAKTVLDISTAIGAVESVRANTVGLIKKTAGLPSEDSLSALASGRGTEVAGG